MVKAVLVAMTGVCTLVLTACESGHAVLTGESLTVTPCADGKARIWKPFRMEMDRLSWNRPAPDVGILTLQRGFRDPNGSDLLVLEFRDIEGLETMVREQPGSEVPLPEAGRLSLSLNLTCPDKREPLESGAGRLRLEAFDLSFGGRIAGTAWFDLADARQGEEADPAGIGMMLDFAVDLTEKDPRTGEGRR
jgi:hypothetical protein